MEPDELAVVRFLKAAYSDKMVAKRKEALKRRILLSSRTWGRVPRKRP